MGGDSSFVAMLRIAGFLAATWGATKVSRLAGVSSIVLEITTGVLLGPGIVGLIPPEYAECEHATYTDCAAPKGFADGLGTLGDFLAPIAATDACDKELYLECAHHPEGHGHEKHGHGPIGFNFTVQNLSFHAITSNLTLEQEVLEALQAVLEEQLANTTAHMGLILDVALHDNGHVLVEVLARPEHEEQSSDAKHALQGLVEDQSFVEGLAEALLAVPLIHRAVAPGQSLENVAVGNFELASGMADISTPHADDDHAIQEDGHGSTSHDRHRRRLSGAHSCDDLDYNSYGDCLVAECEIEVQATCQRTPDVFTLIGHTGVAMMIFESGMHFDFKMARKVGPWACVVAVIGTILPLLCGMLVSLAFGKPAMPDGMTAGTALAPTSVGISLRLLSEAGVLQEEFGQSIMTAAFVDDILSLVLFNIIFSLGDGHFNFMHTFFPSIMGILFMMFAVVLAVVFWPKFLTRFVLPSMELAFERAHSIEDEELDIQDKPHAEHKAKPSVRDEALFMIMLMMLLGYAMVTYLCGTHLWGCFIAGMSFACLEPVGHAHHVWVKQTKRVTSWMIRIFFSCTVAFAIPVTELLSISAFWKGAIMGIGPCILTKVCCALFMGRPKFVIGWAMVGRAEFAYLIAQMGVAGNMIDQELFSIVIWALLWATIFAPIVFRIVLVRYIRDNDVKVGGGGNVTRHSGVEDHGKNGNNGRATATAPDGVALGQQSDRVLNLCLNVSTGTKDSDAVTHEAGDAWEDGVLEKQEREEAGVPLKASEGGGRGLLCCVFYKKAALV